MLSSFGTTHPPHRTIRIILYAAAFVNPFFNFWDIFLMSPLSSRQTAALRHLCSRCVLSLHNSTDFGVPREAVFSPFPFFFCQQKFCTNQTKSLKFPAPRMTVAHRHGKSRPSKTKAHKTMESPFLGELQTYEKEPYWRPRWMPPSGDGR